MLKKLLLSIVCLLAATVAAFAQGPFGGETPPPGFISAVGRKVIESTAEGTTSTAMYFAAMDNAEMRKDLGFSDEQNKQMRDMRSFIQSEMIKRAPQTIERMRNFGPNVEKEMTAEIQDAIQRIRGRLDQISTPEQKEKVKKLSFQAFGGLDSPFVNEEMISTLNLSDEQKEKAAALFTETEKERREVLEAGLKLAEKAVALGGPRMSQEDRDRLNQEGDALQGRVLASGKKLGSKIREFLTDAQKKQADQLMAERPSYLGKLPPGMQPQENDSEWKPSDSSWRPGQGVAEPSQRRDPGSRRFPTAPSSESKEAATVDENIQETHAV